MHFTFLSLMNMILCVSDLVSTFLWKLLLMNIELLLMIFKLLECCCWTMYYETCKLLGWVGFMQGLPVLCSHSLCLEVCLLGTAWFGTHPLLLQIFVGYEPGSSWYLSFFSFSRHLVEDCEVAVCHLSELSYSSLWLFFTWKTTSF